MLSIRSAWTGALRRLRSVAVIARGALLLIACSAMVGGCFNSRGGDIAYNPEGFGRPDAPAPVQDLTAYQLQPLDTISVRVFQVPELSGDAQLDVTGIVALPLIGEVPARGLTSRELSQELKERYSEQYLQDPDVFVSIQPAQAQQVTVDGSVRAPGVYPWAQNMTLIDAVARGGGTTEAANPRRVVIFRKIDGQRQAAAFDLTDIRRGMMDDPLVFADDTIVIDGSDTRQTFREVLQAIPIFAIFRPF